MTKQDQLVEFSCYLEETNRWLYSEASHVVHDPKAKAMLQRLAEEETSHLATIRRVFNLPMQELRWSHPVGGYVLSHVLKSAAPRVSTDNVTELLKVAYAIEVGTAEFYKRWATTMSDPDMCSTVNFLVEAEIKHREWVSQVHEELCGTPLSDEGLDGSLVDWPEL